jgi:hypothetical protein
LICQRSRKNVTVLSAWSCSRACATSEQHAQYLPSLDEIFRIRHAWRWPAGRSNFQ